MTPRQPEIRLAGDVAHLRALRIVDLERLARSRVSSTDWTLTMGSRIPPDTSRVSDWYSAILGNGNVAFAICPADSDDAVGVVRLHDIDQVSRVSWFAISLDEPTVRGRGIGREATQLTLDYARDALDLRRVSLYVVEYNSPAIGMYSALGFKREGLLADHYYLAGDYHDVALLTRVLQS